MNQTSIVEYRDVVKTFGSGATEVRAVNGITLSVAPGEFVAVMGPSGCGKSTLLHLGGGLEPATSGHVLFGGADLATVSGPRLAEIRRRHLGYVFQSLNLVPSLTALENVMLPLELDGMSIGAARAAATEALARVGVTEQIERFPDSFSGGQQQRIAIARGVVGERQVLFADEPTGALDTLTADQVIEVLAQLSGSGVAVVMVTHEPRFASWADRVVFLARRHDRRRDGSDRIERDAMTLLADPPDTTPAPASMPTSPRSPISTWRLASRLARRETRRRPGRTVLVSLLIAVPVLAMTLGSVLVRTHGQGREWPNQFERRYGVADVAVDANVASFTNSDVSPNAVPPGTRSLDYLWVYTFLPPDDPSGTEQTVVLTDAPLDDPMVSSAVEIIDGRAPAVGEVLIGPDLANDRGLEPGDELTLDRPSGTWTVSGVGRYRDDYWVDLLVIPGFDRDRIVADRQQVVQVYDLPNDLDQSGISAFAAAIGGLNRFEDPNAGWAATPILGWGWLAGVLSLVAIGIIVAAAFATSARRQIVTVGQLASNGATPAVIRRSLALQGTWTAVIGTTVGMVVALAALPFVRGPVARHVLNYELTAYVISIRDLTIVTLTAVTAGTVAAAVPARTAARVPVMSALAGRRPQPAPPRWLVPTGLGLAAGGLGLLAVAGTGARIDGSNSFVWPLLAVIAAVGVVFGMVCATPLLVASVGRFGRSAPLSWRFALRSLARSRTRSAAVVAAIAVTVGGAVAGSAVVEKVMRGDLNNELPAMPADAVVVLQNDDIGCCDSPTDADPLRAVDVPDDIVVRLDTLFPDATFEPLIVATYDPPLIDWDNYTGAWPDLQGPVVATPAMLDILGLDRTDVATLTTEGSLWPPDPSGFSQVTVLSDTGEVVAAGTTYPAEGGDIALTPPLGQHVPRYGYSLSRPIVTPDYAEQRGFDLVQRGVIIRTGTPLTVTQRQALDSSFRLDDPWVNGTFIEPGDPPFVVSDGSSIEPYWSYGYDEPRWRQGERDLWRARAIVLVAALLMTGFVVAIGLSLAAAEGRDESDILSVVGARPSSLRRQAAARAVVLAGIGIALGTPTGYVPTWVLFRTTSVGSISDGFEQPLRFPWILAGSIVLVIPLVVAAIAWAGSGVAQRRRSMSPIRRD